MIVGERLRGVREKKNLSRGDIEKRTGLLRCYISRVENGHTVPSRGRGRSFQASRWRSHCINSSYDGEEPPNIANVVAMKPSSNTWGSTGKDASSFRFFGERA